MKQISLSLWVRFRQVKRKFLIFIQGIINLIFLYIALGIIATFFIDVPLEWIAILRGEQIATFIASGLSMQLKIAINILFLPIFIVIAANCSYNILSTITPWIPGTYWRQSYVRLFLFFFLSIFFLAISILALLSILVRELMLFSFNSYNKLYLPLCFFSTSLASARICYESTKFWFQRKQEQSTILFLRKFKTPQDFIAPILIESAVSPNDKCITLVSQYTPKTLGFSVRSFFIVPFWRRLLNPFALNLEYFYTTTQNWRTTVRNMIVESAGIVVDITDFSDSIQEELDFIVTHQKKEKTILLVTLTSRKDSVNSEVLSRIKSLGFNVDENLIICNYSGFALDYVKSRKEVLQQMRDKLFPIVNNYNDLIK